MNTNKNLHENKIHQTDDVVPIRVMIRRCSHSSEVGWESSAGSVNFGCMGGSLRVSRELFWFLLGCECAWVMSKVGENIAIDVNVLLGVDAGEGVHCEGSGEGERVEDVSRH